MEQRQPTGIPRRNAGLSEASAHGWKTFAVVPKGQAAFSGKQCPATVENSSAQCRTCALCDGAKLDVFVEAHGSGAKHFKGQ